MATSCQLVASAGDLSDPDCPPLQFPAGSGVGTGSTIAFVCLEDDAAGLRAAIRARRSLEEHAPVVVCTTKRASSVTELLSGSGSSVLPNETYRRSNRDLAFDIGAKLRRVDCAIEPMADWDAPVFVFSFDELELLARLEHERWSADRRRDGWVYGPERTAEKKLHPDLVPWEQLSEDVRDKDREAVRLIPGLLATYAGFSIVRRPLADATPVIPTVPARVDSPLPGEA